MSGTETKVITEEVVDEESARRERLDEELRKVTQFSQDLQAALSPRNPSLGEGYKVAYKSISAYKGQEISGDLYDAMYVGNTGFVMIGDVAGKDIHAASVAACTRHTVGALALTEEDFGQVLTKANNALYALQKMGRMSSGLFVTLFLMSIDLVSGQIQYSCAGHPPAAVFRAASRKVDFLKEGGVPLAIVDGYQYSVKTSHLEPGDKLVLYTDGISEARCGNQFFGEEGIARCLEKFGQLPAQELPSQMIGEAREWSCARLMDDTAILVVERGIRA